MILSYTNKTKTDKYSLTTRCPVSDSCQWVTSSGVPVVLLTTAAWHVFIVVDSTVLEVTVQNFRGGVFNRIARCFMCPENGKTNLSSVSDAVDELTARGDFVEVELFHKDLKYPHRSDDTDAEDGEDEGNDSEDRSSLEVEDVSEHVCLRLFGTEARFTRNDLEVLDYVRI